MNRETKTKYGGGTTGFMAEDPGAKGRFLWSVRFPAHECYKVRPKGEDAPAHLTADKWHCALGGKFANGVAPQSFRSGVAIGEAAAKKAMDEAANEGRPMSGDKQFVMAHRHG